MRRIRYGDTALNDKTMAVARVHEAVQVFVDTMVDQRTGGRFEVLFSTTGIGAMTNLEKQKIVLPGSIMLDPDMLLDQIATVLTGLAAHEVGHTIYSRDTQKVMDALIAKEGITPRVMLIKKLFNILDDVTLERAMKGDYPGIATTFPAFAEWIAETEDYAKREPRVWEPEHMRAGDRCNFVLSATRFARFLPWGEDEETLAKRKAWQRWAALYSKPDIRVRVAGIKVALAEIMRDMPVPTEAPTPDEDTPEPIRVQWQPLGENERGEAKPQPKPEPQADPSDEDDGLDYDEGKDRPAPDPADSYDEDARAKPEPEPEPAREGDDGTDMAEDGNLGDDEAKDMADEIDKAMPDIPSDSMDGAMNDMDDVINREKERNYDGSVLDGIVKREQKSEKIARSEFGSMRIEIR